MEHALEKYKNNIFIIESVLQEYHAEDRLHLLSEKNRLKEKIQNVETIVTQAGEYNEEHPEGFRKYYEDYFEDLKCDFEDFLIILKWCNFGEIQKKLWALKKAKSLVNFQIQRNNSHSLSYLLSQDINESKEGYYRDA